MEKYIKSLENLNLGKKINGGSCGNIYEFDKNLLFKEFENEYKDLSDSINFEFYEVIKYLSELEGMPFIVRGNDIYRSKNEFFGYSMDKISAINFTKVSDDTMVNDVLLGFKLLSSDIRTLADNYVKTEDVGGDNILFNGYMYLIDLDLSLIDKRYNQDELYEKTMNNLFNAVISKLIGISNNSEKILDARYIEFLVKLRDKCSEALEKDIITINDMKKGYQKIKKM